MNELMVFQNPEFGEVRTLTRDGEPWFVLRDVCDALAIASTKDAFARLDDDERGFAPIIDGAGRTQKTSIINESGLYSVIMRSNKPEAKPFRKWVTSEVLPSIRKTGTYTNKPMTVAENLAAQAQLLVEQEKRLTRIEQRVETALTAMARPAADTWTEDMKAAIAGYCAAAGLTEITGRGRLYEMLDREANCGTDARLANLRKRKKEAGERRKDYMALTKLDAIALDKKLRVAFEGIVARETARAAQK